LSCTHITTRRCITRDNIKYMNLEPSPQISTRNTEVENKYPSYQFKNNVVLIFLFTFSLIGFLIGYNIALLNMKDNDLYYGNKSYTENKLNTNDSPMSELEIETFPCDYVQYEDDLCYRLVSKEIIVPDLTAAFRSQVNTSMVLTEQYFSEGADVIYFRAGIPNSSGCCTIVAFDKMSQTFTKNKFSYSPGDKASPDGRLIAQYDGQSLNIIDVVVDDIITKINFSAEETPAYSYCGYAGSSSRLMWLDDTTLEYDIYSAASFVPDPCQGEYIESRLLKVRLNE
jgi:hypothetical protein